MEQGAESTEGKSRSSGSQLHAPCSMPKSSLSMAATIGFDMPATIRKLARIYDDNQLEALLLDWANDCRGLTADDSQLFTAGELMRVRGVTNSLVQTCGFSAAEI